MVIRNTGVSLPEAHITQWAYNGILYKGLTIADQKTIFNHFAFVLFSDAGADVTPDIAKALNLPKPEDFW